MMEVNLCFGIGLVVNINFMVYKSKCFCFGWDFSQFDQKVPETFIYSFEG